MMIQKVLNIIHFSILFLLIFNISIANLSHASEFEIDEIITAIKNEIKTANISELGSPNFKIETVDVALTVVSTVTEKGSVAVNIIGYDNEAYNQVFTSKTFHKLKFSFQPAGASGYSPEISLGLVEPIKKVKEAMRKAYNTPPNYQMEGFTFKLEFAIEKNIDSGIRFTIIALNDLKAQNINTHYLTIHMKIQD